MENWLMKALIAAPCIAAIALVVILVWDDQDTTPREAEMADCLNNKADLESGAGSDAEKVAAKAAIRNCVRKGIFDREEVRHLDLGT